MSSKNYKIHGDEDAVWAKVESTGCSRRDGIKLMDIDPEIGYALDLARASYTTGKSESDMGQAQVKRSSLCMALMGSGLTCIILKCRIPNARKP
jgi:hypothetical protein